MFTKRLVNFSLALLIATENIFANPLSYAACEPATKAGASTMQVIMTSVATMYNIFPIRIAGIPIDYFPDTEDIPSSNDMPICICSDPFPRIGIPVSYWEPIALMEVTSIPFCSPTFGHAIPIPLGPGAMSFSQHDNDNDRKTNTYQAHYVKFPLFKLLQLLADFVCLAPDGSVDYAYITELDPLWQNDIWAAIIGPEAFLVANPIAELACVVDSVTASAGFPLDPLWWCLGSWNGTFPMTMNNKGTVTMEAQAAITSRMLMKLHRQLMLWGSIGEQGLCGIYPMPIMRKSQYGIFPLYPIPWPFRIPIGRTAHIWGVGQENPANQHVGEWAIYRKRNCCVL